MRRFILTGAPGAGKTAIVRELEARGFPVVEEAATDVIAREQAAGVDILGPRTGKAVGHQFELDAVNLVPGCRCCRALQSDHGLDMMRPLVRDHERCREILRLLQLREQRFFEIERAIRRAVKTPKP